MSWITKHFSSLLILVPLILLILVYWPIIIQEYHFRTSPQVGEPLNIKPKNSEFGIVIPKLGINEQVIASVDPFNYQEYMKALTQGVAHAANSLTPDQDGTTYVFAHSSDNPFSITRYNTAFYLLDRLIPGDDIVVYYQYQPYFYKVTHFQVVKPWEAEALTNTTTPNQLILQTCTPVGTSINRLLVFAEKTDRRLTD